MIAAGLAHVAGAAGSGAAVGLLAASLGTLLPEAARIALLVGAVVWAWIERSTLANLGWRRQVPRWDRLRMPRPILYSAWGALLGTGLLTVIPHSGYLVFIGLEANAGIPLGIVAGAVCGASRALVAVIVSLQAARLDQSPDQIATTYLRLRDAADRYNRLLVPVGGVLAVFAVVVGRPA